MPAYSGGALKATGALWTWGSNTATQLGQNTAAVGGSVSSPVAVVGSHAFVYIYGHGNNATWHALKANGECWGWGANSGASAGTIGDGTGTDRSSPVSVVGAHAFVKISGDYHTLALKANGECWAWGYNAVGELGILSVTAKNSPVSVVGNHAFVYVGTDTNISAGLKANGECWTWGFNNIGQLADGTTTNRSSPVSVVGNHAFTQIVGCGGRTTFIALKANGECWSWGYNADGELGDGSVTLRSSPVSVVGNHAFIQIAKATAQTAALKANGEVWCWGANESGQLGDNTTVAKSSPVSVVGAHSFIQIQSVQNGFLALKSNGEVWAWGSNGRGVLGDNTTTAKSSPVLVVGSHVFAGLTYLPTEDESSSSSSSISSASSASSLSSPSSASSNSSSSISSESSESSESSISSLDYSSASSISSVSSPSSESSESSESSVSSESSSSLSSPSSNSSSSSSSAVPVGFTWGCETPPYATVSEPWTGTWVFRGTLNQATNSGAYGLLLLRDYDSFVSDVKDSEAYRQKRIIISYDDCDYGTGQGKFYYRASNTIFAKDDEITGPTWILYTSSVVLDYRYVQLRVDGM